MKRARRLMVIVPALSLVLTSGALAQTQQRENSPAPDVTFESEMPPPSSSDIQSERINRKSTGHLGEYQERDQGVPTGMATDTKKSDKMNRRVNKNTPSSSGQ